MKHDRWMCVPLVLALLLPTIGCKKKGDKTLNVLPAGARAVFSLDFSRFAQQSFFDRIVTPNSAQRVDNDQNKSMPFKSYQEFVSKTGIDPKKDVDWFAGAVYGKFQAHDMEMVLAVHARYDRDKVLALLRQAKPGMKEETRGGAIVCSMMEPADQPIQVAMFDNGLMLAGSAARVREAIDLVNGQGRSVLGDDAIKKQLARVNRSNMFWLVVTVPDEMKKTPQASSLPVDMSKAETLLLALDYKDKTLSGDLQLVQPDEKANTQIATTLNGFKGMGAMAAAKEPDLGELLNSIQITSSADNVRLTFSMPEKLMNKLGDKAKEKALAQAGPVAPVAAEVPADDNQ